MRNISFLPFIAASALLWVAPALAQSFQPKTILFQGVPEYSDKELMETAGLKKGMTLSNSEMGDHAKALMDTGMFANMSYKFDGLALTFTLVPTDQLYAIRLANLPLDAGPALDAKLHERFPLYHGKVPPEGGMLDGVRGALEEMLAARGIKATVMAVPYTNPQQRKVTAMSFSIQTPPVLVGEIHVDAGSPPLDAKAQEVLTKMTGSPYDLHGSPDQIATYMGNVFHDEGYLEAEIHAAPQGGPVVGADAVRIPFSISVAPGPLYKLSSVQLGPGMLVTQAEFDKQSHIHAGDVADGQHVTENWQYLSRQYHNKGYMKARIEPVATFDRAQGTVSFTVNAVPGPQFNMGTLRIDNVSDALRTAMLAAWKMQPGTPFDESAILKFFAIGDVNPALKNVFSQTDLKYTLAANDETHTVDVVLRLDKKR